MALAVCAALAVTAVAPAHAGVLPKDDNEVRALLAKVAQTGDVATMSQLLKEGVEVNLLDSTGQPPLITAILAGHDDVGFLLLDHNATVYTRTTKGMTALHAAAYVGDVDMVRRLIRDGADVNDQANIAGITPLHAAAEENHLAVVKMLLKAGADVKRVEVNGYTAGSRAGWREYWDVVRFLLNSGDTCQPKDLAGPWLYEKCTNLNLSASN